MPRIDSPTKFARPIHAGFWRRAGALFVDTLILSFPAGLLALSGTQLDFALELALWVVVDGVYYSLFHSSSWQATPGKRAFGIKVTDLEGERIGLRRAIARYVASILSGLVLGVGYLMVAWSRRKQALHDLIASTLVVDAAASNAEVATASGVMALPARMKMSIALLAVATIGMQVGLFAFTDSSPEPGTGLMLHTVTPEQEERLSYAIYTYPFFGGERTMVAEGTRVYRHEEIRARDIGDSDSPYIVKSLPVANGFDVEANVVPEETVDGFGLTLRREGQGFSWDWFNREQGDVFRKLQGPGRVRVRFAATTQGQELAGIEFLEDVTLRLDRWWLVPFHHGDSDHLVVKKGSVLWLRD